MTITPDMQAQKTRLKSMWSAGDYGHFATYLAPGERCVGGAWGAGRRAGPAARAGAVAPGLDIAPNSTSRAGARGRAEGLGIRFEEGDAEELPYEDGSFDIVVSLIGAMFAPRPEFVTAELKRVCRPGGKIIMGNWTPTGFVGQMFKIHGKHVPPPAIMTPTVKWGDEEIVRERFKDGISHLKLRRHLYPFRYPFPPSEVVEFFRTYYGPTYKAFAALDAEKQSALRADLEQLWM